MLYIGTDEGIYRWYNGTPWPIFHSLQDRGIVHLVSPGRGVLVAADVHGRIGETTDNGQSWREITAPLGAGRPTALALFGSPSELVVASRPLALHRRPVGPDPTLPRLGMMAAADRQLAEMFGRALTFAQRARARRDGGVGTGHAATAVAEPPPEPGAADPMGWTPLGLPDVESGPIPPVVRAILPGPTSWLLAVAGQGLWRSDNAGASWQRCDGLPDEVYTLRAVPKAEGSVVAATSDGVRVSADDGRTWEDRSGGLEKVRHVRAIDVKPSNPNHLLVGAAPSAPGEGPVAPRGGLQFALYESKDGGKSWSHVRRGFPEVLESDSITDIRFDPTDPDYAVVALASGELWSTRSDGLWWEPLARMIRTARCLCAVP